MFILSLLYARKDKGLRSVFQSRCLMTPQYDTIRFRTEKGGGVKQFFWLGVLIVMTGLIAIGRTQEPAPKSPSIDSGFSIVFGYGVITEHLNVIDTIKGTFTKDMVLPPHITVDMKLTDAELGQIEKKLDAMGFWNADLFPPVFSVPNTSTTMGCGHAPSSPISIQAIRNGIVKTLTWADTDSACFMTQPAQDLRALEKMIRNMIEAKPEYQKLPRGRGGYG